MLRNPAEIVTYGVPHQISIRVGSFLIQANCESLDATFTVLSGKTLLILHEIDPMNLSLSKSRLSGQSTYRKPNTVPFPESPSFTTNPQGPLLLPNIPRARRGIEDYPYLPVPYLSDGILVFRRCLFCGSKPNTSFSSRCRWKLFFINDVDCFIFCMFGFSLPKELVSAFLPIKDVEAVVPQPPLAHCLGG